VLWQLLHDGGSILVGQAPVALVAYPALSWMGVIAGTEWAGYARRQLNLPGADD
jgi:hypothetical protein